MLVFLIANLPLPIITYLNVVVTMKYLKVQRLAKRRQVRKPSQLVLGWWLGNISMIFALAPAIAERRLFVQNPWWLVSYSIAATLSIAGLTLMNNGLGLELRQLMRRQGKRHTKRRRQ